LGPPVPAGRAKIYFHSEFPILEEFNDETAPMESRTEEKYIDIPDKRRTASRQATGLLISRAKLARTSFDDVRYMFSKRGAYKKFARTG